MLARLVTEYNKRPFSWKRSFCCADIKIINKHREIIISFQKKEGFGGWYLIIYRIREIILLKTYKERESESII